MNAFIESGGSKGPRQLLLNVQAALTCVGFLLNLVILFADIAGGAGILPILSLIATLVAFGAIAGYCMGGYRTAEVRLFRIAVWAVAGMFFFKSLSPALTVFDSAVLVSGFGLALIFNEKLSRPKSALAVMGALIAVLVIGAVVALVRPFTGEAANLVNVLGRLIPWTHVILACTLALVYANERQDLSEADRRRRA